MMLMGGIAIASPVGARAQQQQSGGYGVSAYS